MPMKCLLQERPFGQEQTLTTSSVAHRFFPPGQRKIRGGWELPALLALFLVLTLIFPAVLAAQMRRVCPAPMENPQFSWGIAPLYAFPSNLNGGGTLSLFTMIANADVNKQMTSRLAAGLSFTYIYDDYNFSGLGGFPRALHPWSSIHTIDVSVPLTYSLNNDCTWKLYMQPLVQFSGENGAQFAESLAFGGIAAVSHVFGPNVELGMGMGVYYNLASISVYPYPIVKLKIGDRLGFSSAFGAAPGGPGGGEVYYILNKHWDIGVGGVYRDSRFRLSQNGPIRHGIGEYQSLPIFGRISYHQSNVFKVEAFGGVSFFNEVWINNRKGSELYKTAQDPAPLVGLSISGTF